MDQLTKSPHPRQDIDGCYVKVNLPLKLPTFKNALFLGFLKLNCPGHKQVCVCGCLEGSKCHVLSPSPHKLLWGSQMIHARLVIPKLSFSVLAAKSRQNSTFVSKPLLLALLRQKRSHLQRVCLTVAYFAIVSGEKEPIRKTNAVLWGASRLIITCLLQHH